MGWRTARCLDTLLTQVDAAWPDRDKSNDGTIGDDRHAATHSEHNPDENGVVRARDITHDPAHGLDARKLAETLIASRDPRILYVISNAQICSSVVSPWTWRAYTGSNDHRHHMHLSVVGNPTLYDSTKPWALNAKIPADPAPVLTGGQSGKGSWYSQFTGKYVWRDPGDAPNSAKLGCPDDAQGVSFYNNATLGKWFKVRAPNGTISIEQQTDVGPSPNTGRKIDISAAAAERFGYTPKNFPTDGVFTWWPIDPPTQVAALAPKFQAAKYRDLRKSLPAPADAPPATESWAMRLIKWITGRG